MDINQSKVSGNIQAIVDLMNQGGIGNNSLSEWDCSNIDVSEHVVLFFGDLGTVERMEALVDR
jgi:hypothetical protein